MIDSIASYFNGNSSVDTDRDYFINAVNINDILVLKTFDIKTE